MASPLASVVWLAPVTLPPPPVAENVTGTPAAGYYPRGQMAGAFGDVGWRLELDQVGVAAYHPDKSPFGWHIIKRIE